MIGIDAAAFLGGPVSTNQTTAVSSIKSGVETLLLNLAGTAAGIGLTSLAGSTGQRTLPTGNPLNPVVVLPSNSAIAQVTAQQQAQASAAAASQLTSAFPLLVFLGVGALIIFAGASVLRSGRGR